MEVRILNPSFEVVAVLDTFESLIWTERYCGYGDFEIYTAVDPALMSFMVQNNYVQKQGTTVLMIIEDVQISTDAEFGNRLTISGRSLESILERRIVWEFMALTGNVQDAILDLLSHNILDTIFPLPARIVHALSTVYSFDPLVTAPTIEYQTHGDNLYELIQAICSVNNLGFRISFEMNVGVAPFRFGVYSGADRSYEQEANPYIVFSPTFENLISTNYLESGRATKTVALVAGEGEGLDTKLAYFPTTGGGEDLTRRELFVSASDITSNIEGGTMPIATYNSHLRERGAEALDATFSPPIFEGQVESQVLFRYGEDYFLGDIVQLRNEYGMEARTRVTEVVTSVGLSGVEVYPTFSAIE